MVLSIFKFDDSRPVFDLLGKVLTCVAPVVGLFVPLALLALGQYNLALLSSYIAIPMIAAPVVYYVYSRRHISNVNLGEGNFKTLLALYFLFYGISALLLVSGEVRPFAYYLVITALATIVLLEIFLCEVSTNKAAVILLQVMAFTLNILWGINQKYYLFVGRTDPLGHAWYGANLLQTGFVTGVFDDYTAFPLWQILFTSVHMATGSAAELFNTMFITSGLIFLLIPVAIYCIAQKITGGKRIALLSALMASFYPYFIILGTQSLSRSITSCLAVVLVLLLLYGQDLKRRALALVLTVIIVVYHPVAIVFITAILFGIYVLQKLLARKPENKTLSIKYFVFTIAWVLAYWVLFAYELIDKLEYNLSSSAPSFVTTQSILVTPLNELFNYLQYLPMMFFIILGVIFLLRTRVLDEQLKIFGLIGLALVPVTFPGPMYLLTRLAGNFNIERFYENGILFMCIAAALGFTILFSKSGKYMKTFIVILFSVMVLLSVSNDFVSSDNPLVKRPFFTYYLTSAEVGGINHDQAVTSGYMMSDYVPTRYVYFSPNRSQFYVTEVDDANQTFFRVGQNDTLLVRQAELGKRPLDLYSLAGNDLITPHRSSGDDVYQFKYYNASAELWGDLKRFNTIYDSSVVQIYGGR